MLKILAAFPCTIGVSSPEIAVANKPLLWKSRDISPNTLNTIRFVENMTYKFVAISTANQNTAWMGVNEMGFAIANSLANDLTVDTGVFYNGNLMYNALGLAANLADFENYLSYLTSHNSLDLELRGNFVAFDATGNTRLYEVNNNNYWVFETDAQNPYLLRTNHSVNGGGSEGIERLLRSTAIIEDLVSDNELTVPNLLIKQIRDISDVQSQPFALPWAFGDASPFYATDYSICRRNTIAAVVIEGIEAGQDPKLTTMWLIMGNPFISYAIPIFPTSKPNLAPIINLSENSPELANILWNSDNDYLLDTSHFINSNNFSLMETLSSTEFELYQATEILKTEWSNNLISDANVREFVNLQAASCLNFSTQLFTNFTPNYNAEVTPLIELNVYPNPFSSNLTLEVSATKGSEGKVSVYNLKGQFVKTVKSAGNNKFYWDGRNSDHEKMAAGIYLIKYETKSESVTKKVVFKN